MYSCRIYVFIVSKADAFQCDGNIFMTLFQVKERNVIFFFFMDLTKTL